MSRMIEPLKPEIEKSKVPGILPLEAYTNGFHDGAYALAQELIQLASIGHSLRDELARYESKDAHPCAGWTHEPNKPEPSHGKPIDMSRPGRWVEGVWIEN